MADLSAVNEIRGVIRRATPVIERGPATATRGPATATRLGWAISDRDMGLLTALAFPRDGLAARVDAFIVRWRYPILGLAIGGVLAPILRWFA